MRAQYFLRNPLLLLFLLWLHISVAFALPSLGTGVAIDVNGNLARTQTSFEGGTSVNGMGYSSYFQTTPSTSITLKARIIVDPADVGKQADLLYVSGIEKSAPFDGGSDTSYFTVNDKSELHELDLYNLASVWMTQLAETPYSRGVILQSEMLITDEGGWQLSDQPSANYYFIGYRLPEGKVVYTTTPIVVNAIQTSNSINTCTYDFETIDRLSFSEQTQYGKTTVTTQSGCQWTASSNTDWITISSGSSGNGTGVVTYAVAPNLGSELKTGTVTIAGKTLTITVPPKPVSSTSCSYEVSPTSSVLPASGKSGVVRVTTQPECNWTASSDTDWINIEFITVNRENGTGTVIYTVAANSTSSQKTGYITVAGTRVAVTISADVNEFSATFKGVEYYKPTGYCHENMMLVWLLFETTGVNTADLQYVEEKSIYQPDPSNPYIESLHAFNSNGFIVRGFCAPLTLKSDFQVRLKEGSTGRLSNTMTFTVDVNSAVIVQEAPPLTTTPGETKPVSNDPILVSPITNPNTDLGFIGTTGKETIGIFGKKDEQGRLISINRISFGSQTDKNQNIVITLGEDYLPTTMEFPDGSKVEYSNYTSDGATATYYHPDGSVGNQAVVPMPFDDIQKGAEAIKQYTQSPQQTDSSDVPSTPGSTNSSSSSNCKEVMGNFCKQVENLIWGSSQLVSVLSCATAATATALTGGFAIPVAIWACGSVVLNGISRMEDVIKGNTGTCGDTDDETPLKKLQGADDFLQEANGVTEDAKSCFFPPSFAKCAITIGKKMAGDFLDDIKDRVLEALDPEKVCQTEPEDICGAIEKVCNKYGTPYGVSGYIAPWCLCDLGEAVKSDEDGKNFVKECKDIGGKPVSMGVCSTIGCFLQCNSL